MIDTIVNHGYSGHQPGWIHVDVWAFLLVLLGSKVWRRGVACPHKWPDR